MDAGTHRVAIVVILVHLAHEFHHVGGGYGAEDAQFVIRGDDSVGPGSDGHLYPALPFHPGKDLAVDVGGLGSTYLDHTVGTGSVHGAGDLDQLEEGSRGDRDASVLPADKGAAFEDYGILGDDGDLAAVLLGLQHAGHALDVVIQPLTGIDNIGHHGGDVFFAVSGYVHGDVTVLGYDPAVVDDPVLYPGQVKIVPGDTGVPSAQGIEDVLGLDVQTLAIHLHVDQRRALRFHFAPDEDTLGIKHHVVAEAGVTHPGLAGELHDRGVHGVAEGHLVDVVA